jgi:hypothetical protein
MRATWSSATAASRSSATRKVNAGWQAALATTLQPRGLLMLRLFTQVARRESLAEVLGALHAGRIGSFHVFKWRLAMALQSDSTTGVKRDDVWRAYAAAGIDPARLPQPGWSPAAIRTIRSYENQQTRLCFPTLDEVRSLLDEAFEGIEVTFPQYELGERCPIVTVTPRRGRPV